MVLCQIPRTIQPHCGFSLCWVWLWHAERKCALLCTPVSLCSTVCCMHSSTASSLQSFPNSFRGDWRPGGNPSFEKGVKFFFLKFQSLFAAISKKKKKEKPAPVDIEYGRKKRSMVYIAQCNCHMKVKLCSFFPPRTG